MTPQNRIEPFISFIEVQKKSICYNRGDMKAKKTLIQHNID